MNDILNSLSDLVRTNLELTQPIVIHCAAGSGKTTLIKKIVKTKRGLFKAYTTSNNTSRDYESHIIQKYNPELEYDNNCILDEYPILNKEELIKFGAIFCDPLQYHCTQFQAHYIQNRSHRLGVQTCNLLQSINKDIIGYKEDKVIIEDIFTGEPEGVIVCFEEEIVELLRAHQADFSFYEEIIGKEFETVTLVTTKQIEELTDHKSYICLTRHKNTLKILKPNAISSSSE
uniref:TGB1 n=1 Tax=Cymodocea nodosa foveavirus 1 TaxID=2794432 RepID=A0A7T5QZC5_9VIRU|nr:TGB1 [Cymodocea nodosa foveavirus 1]